MDWPGQRRWDCSRWPCPFIVWPRAPLRWVSTSHRNPGEPLRTPSVGGCTLCLPGHGLQRSPVRAGSCSVGHSQCVRRQPHSMYSHMHNGANLGDLRSSLGAGGRSRCDCPPEYRLPGVRLFRYRYCDAIRQVAPRCCDHAYAWLSCFEIAVVTGLI